MNDSSERKCPSCESIDIQEDDATGLLVCIKCGYVIEESFNFQYQQGAAFENGVPSERVGYFVSEDDDGTLAGGAFVGRGGHISSTSVRSRAQAVRRAKDVIDRLGASLRLPAQVSQLAKDLLYQLLRASSAAAKSTPADSNPDSNDNAASSADALPSDPNLLAAAARETSASDGHNDDGHGKDVADEEDETSAGFVENDEGGRNDSSGGVDGSRTVIPGVSLSEGSRRSNAHLAALVLLASRMEKMPLTLGEVAAAAGVELSEVAAAAGSFQRALRLEMPRLSRIRPLLIRCLTNAKPIFHARTVGDMRRLRELALQIEALATHLRFGDGRSPCGVVGAIISSAAGSLFPSAAIPKKDVLAHHCGCGISALYGTQRLLVQEFVAFAASLPMFGRAGAVTARNVMSFVPTLVQFCEVARRVGSAPPPKDAASQPSQNNRQYPNK